MDISIVSGTYNRLPYLQKMVTSVRQSIAGVYGLEYEIVLVDGGSNDTTQEWCRLQPDIRLIEHGELRGAVKAFNEGAYAAAGRYVIMGNDDIEFVGNSILVAYAYMETHPLCGAGCFWQNRNDRDWHVEGMQAVHAEKKIVNNVVVFHSASRVHVHYAQVGIFPKWLGDLVGWWCNELEYGQCLKNKNYGSELGLHTYGGDNELSAQIWDLGYTVEPVYPDSPRAKISDSEAKDGLREINNIVGAHDPRAVQGHHPDSYKFGQKWINRNEALGIHGHYPGPILKDKPMVQNPISTKGKERVLYLPLFEQGWTVQKEQKRGLRDALAHVALVYEFDYEQKTAAIGKARMLAELGQIANDFRPTVFLSQIHNAGQINSPELKTLRQICGASCRFVNWNGDYWPDQLLRQDGLDLARSFDLMTSVNRDVVEKHRAHGINTQYWQIGWEPLGRGYEPAVYHEVVFLASGYSKERQDLGRWLTSQPYSVGLFGHGWPGEMAKGENLYNFIEACRVYRGSKLAIGDSQWPDSGFVSNRIMQILAAGNTVLCHQWFRGYEELGLIDGHNCLIWKDTAELARIFTLWLHQTAALKTIAGRGEQLAIDQHGFDVRVSELWQMLGISETQDQVWRW